jgi:hypothetical protein
MPTPGQKLYKRIPFSCHTCSLPLLWHELLHVNCQHIYFLWRHHLPLGKSGNGNSNWFTYYIDIWLLILIFTFSLRYLSESCFGNDNTFLGCFVFHLPNILLAQNFVYPTLFSSVPPPAINNDRSLNSFYFGYRSPIRLRNNFINPIRNEYFGSEIRTNRIGFGSVSDRICTPLLSIYKSLLGNLNT